MQMNEFQQFILINILYNFIKIFICKKGVNIPTLIRYIIKDQKITTDPGRSNKNFDNYGREIIIQIFSGRNYVGRRRCDIGMGRGDPSQP